MKSNGFSQEFRRTTNSALTDRSQINALCYMFCTDWRWQMKFKFQKSPRCRLLIIAPTKCFTWWAIKTFPTLMPPTDFNEISVLNLAPYVDLNPTRTFTYTGICFVCLWPWSTACMFTLILKKYICNKFYTLIVNPQKQKCALCWGRARHI